MTFNRNRTTRNITVSVYLGDVEIVLTGDLYPETYATAPSYGSGGDPGSAAEFDIDKVRLKDGSNAEDLWAAIKDATKEILETEALSAALKQVE